MFTYNFILGSLILTLIYLMFGTVISDLNVYFTFYGFLCLCTLI